MPDRLTAALPVRAVVLDMDGLMLDTETNSRAARQRTLAEWGFSLSEERYLQPIGLTIADVGEKMRGWYGADLPYDAIRRPPPAVEPPASFRGAAPRRPESRERLTLSPRPDKIAAISTISFSSRCFCH